MDDKLVNIQSEFKKYYNSELKRKYKELEKERANNLFWFLGFDGVIKEYITKLFHKNRQEVRLEDVVFSRKWNVYADDQVEARYVLTPVMMERMVRVKKMFHGNRLDFGFWDKEMLIAIHTGKDMFETTSLFTPALDYKKKCKK